MKSNWILMSAFAAALTMVGSGIAQTPAVPAPKATTHSKTSPKKAVEAVPAPTAQDITDAKAKGMVWVNTSTKVYHKDGSQYGTTKKGKFMTEDEAKAAGYKAAKTPVAKAAPAPKK